MKNTFINWERFSENLDTEIQLSDDVYKRMKKSGLKEYCFTKMDFTFISNKKENLENLATFLKSNYQYSVEEIKINEGLWELNGKSNEIPITASILLYWVLDMNKKGYEFDSKFEAYGGPFDETNQTFPDFNKSNEEGYFNTGLEYFNRENLSGAFIYWTLCIAINSQDPNSFYSRAIVKEDLYLWKDALKDYDEAIRIAPDFVSAIINRGSLKDYHKDFKGAIEDYNKALLIKNIDLENKKRAFFNRGNTKLNLNDKIEACKDWEIAYNLGAEYAKKQLDKYCKK